MFLKIPNGIACLFVPAVILGLAFSAQAIEYPACGPRTLKTYELLGPVKSVRFEEPGEDGRPVLVSLWLFGRSGRLLEDRHQITIGDDSGHPGYQVFRNIYEPQGRNFETDMFDIDPAEGEKPINLQRHLVKFDALGRCIEESDIDSDGKFNGKNLYEYDDNSNLIREVDYDWAGTVFANEDRSYTPEGKLLSEEIVEHPGKDSMSRLSRWYEYDAQGNKTDMFSYRQGVLEAHWIFKYDEHNRMISSQCIVADPKQDQQVYGRCFDCGLSSGKTTFKYDEAGHVLETRMFQPDGKLVNTFAGGYDVNGNRLTSPDNAYSYDSHGNWIKEVSSQSSSKAPYRVIDYY